MVTQDKEPVDPVTLIYDMVCDFRQDMDGKFADLGKQVAEISAYVIEAKAFEKARDLAAEIKDLKQAVSAQKELNAEYRGQIIMLRWIAGATGFLVAALGLLQLFKIIPGR